MQEDIECFSLKQLVVMELEETRKNGRLQCKAPRKDYQEKYIKCQKNPDFIIKYLEVLKIKNHKRNKLQKIPFKLKDIARPKIYVPRRNIYNMIQLKNITNQKMWSVSK